MKCSTPRTSWPTLLDRANQGGFTLIWVACARIAAIFRPTWARASISVVTSLSAQPNGMSSTGSTRKGAPLSRIASSVLYSTDLGAAVW